MKETTTENHMPRNEVVVLLEPENRELRFPRLNTALQALNKTGRRPGWALVIRGGELLTPDRTIHPGDRIVIRDVISRG